jgi:RNA polymerase sigma factor (sigma-70 family)
MPRVHAGPAVRHLHQLLGTHRSHELTDAELLQRFVTHREETAFAALLQRHGRLVMGVCRRVLPRTQDAEDAFQATFLTLVRRAGSIRNTEAVGSWLYCVARRIATKVGVDMARRSAREKSFAPGIDAPASPKASSEASLRELQAVLDEELDRLPEKYRAPFVLCCLEGKSRPEAARALGWKEGTVGGRLAQARKLLQRRLTRRGVALSGALAAVALTPHAQAVVPAVLYESTLRAALRYAAGPAAAVGAVSAPVAALVKGATRTMVFTKLKVATAILLTVGVVAAGALAKPQAAKDDEPEVKVAKPQAAQGAKPQAAGQVAAQSEDGEPLAFAGRVLDPDGKPAAGAKLYLLYYTPKVMPIPVRDTSDEDGHFHFRVPRTEFDRGNSAEPWNLAIIVAMADGYGLGIPRSQPGKSRTEQTIQLVKDDLPVRGRVLDLQGKPLAGVTVSVGGLHYPIKGDLWPFLNALKETKLFYPPVREFLTGFGGAGWAGTSAGSTCRSSPGRTGASPSRASGGSGL